MGLLLKEDTMKELSINIPVGTVKIGGIVNVNNEGTRIDFTKTVSVDEALEILTTIEYIDVPSAQAKEIQQGLITMVQGIQKYNKYVLVSSSLNGSYV